MRGVGFSVVVCFVFCFKMEEIKACLSARGMIL